MIYIAFRKRISEQQIDALHFLARQQPIAFLDPLPDLEIAMQAVYNGHTDIFKSGKDKPNDRDIILLFETIENDTAKIWKKRYPKAPPFKFNDDNFEEWFKVQFKTNQKTIYFGFSNRKKIRVAMEKSGITVGGPGELITLVNRMKKMIAESLAKGKAA